MSTPPRASGTSTATRPGAGAAGRAGLALDLDLFSAIFDLAPTAVAVLRGTEHRYVYVNEAYRRLARGKGEVIGRTLPAVWPEAGPAIVAVLDRVFSNGAPFQAENQPFEVHRDRGPETVWLTFSFVPLRTPAGEVDGILVMVNEVTEHVRALRVTTDAAEGLRASEARALARAAELQTVLDTVPAAVWIARDPRGDDIEANRFGADLLRRPRGSNVSISSPHGDAPRNFRVESGGVPLTADELPIQAAARGGVEIRDSDLDLIFDDGTVLHLLGNAAPLRDGAGAVRGSVGAFIDITRRKRAEAALRLENERKTQFLAILSHELRNPLAPIRNSLLILDRAEPGTERARRARAVLHRQTEHLSRLVDDLLDAARISGGKVELRRTRVDARDVAHRACDDVRALYDERGIALREPVGAPAWVDADPARLLQMIGNLLQNALKFTPPEGRVDVTVQAGGGTCRISVRDTGVGIAPGDLGRVFTPFAQADRTRAYSQGGLGIGLALTRELAALHGGTVHASSPGVGQGAEFVIELPLTSPGAGAEDRPAPAAASGLSILVVEDNPDAATTLADLLAIHGHAVRTVGSGRAAVDEVRRERPEVLICDVGLPDLSGYEVIRAVRAAAGGGGPFAVALTGYAQPRDRDEALRAGFDAHLAKPPEVEALTALLREVAARRAAG